MYCTQTDTVAHPNYLADRLLFRGAVFFLHDDFGSCLDRRGLDSNAPFAALELGVGCRCHVYTLLFSTRPECDVHSYTINIIVR